ncbi:hypothetical protein [Acinetobacter sp.]|uniref:hypothetical protein n=1 Tax=Acinetobacter sp. TaxID=472 RepID=UPI00388F6A0C
MHSTHHKIGNILEEVKQGIIIHQVNAQGVMDGGIALSIRNKWPKVWKDYSAIVKPNQPDNGFQYMGKVIYTEVGPELWVASIVGQQFYGRDKRQVYTSYESLEMGFHSVGNFALNKDLDVHYPLIGCGLANGDWITVSQIIANRLVKIKHTLWELPEE